LYVSAFLSRKSSLLWRPFLSRSLFLPSRHKVSTGAFAHVNVSCMPFSTCVSSVCLYSFSSLLPIFLCSTKHPLISTSPSPDSRYAQKDNEMKKEENILNAEVNLHFFLRFPLRCWGCNFDYFLLFRVRKAGSVYINVMLLLLFIACLQ
jgi:hypothetical protein